MNHFRRALATLPLLLVGCSGLDLRPGIPDAQGNRWLWIEKDVAFPYQFGQVDYTPTCTEMTIEATAHCTDQGLESRFRYEHGTIECHCTKPDRFEAVSSLKHNCTLFYHCAPSTLHPHSESAR
ncbi:MAG: hypothetical protein HQL50_10020 [Magnetococcales bacterium]|nr:hypothetical protein [Magnetococcales bacterium]